MDKSIDDMRSPVQVPAAWRLQHHVRGDVHPLLHLRLVPAAGCLCRAGSTCDEAASGVPPAGGVCGGANAAFRRHPFVLASDSFFILMQRAGTKAR